MGASLRAAKKKERPSLRQAGNIRFPKFMNAAEKRQKLVINGLP